MILWRRPALPLALALATFLLESPALAAWPTDPNVNVPLCTAANNQLLPISISDGSGGAITTWYDLRSGNYDIYVQRVNAAGVPVWTANGVALCTAASDQVGPVLVSDGAGGAIITWSDLRGGTYDIYAQRVNSAGVPQWTANGVALCTAVNDQSSPAIASDGSGGAIIAWQDNRSGTNDIYAQRVNAAGAAQWAANGVVLCSATNAQGNPTILSDGAGGAIVTWQDQRSGNVDLYMQRVNGSGTPQWTADGVALCTAAGEQDSPKMVSDGAGGMIVAWYDLRSAATFDIYAQRVNGSGATLWTANGQPICTATSDQYSPTIVSDGLGGAIITWYDYRGASGDIYAQHMSTSGVAEWPANGIAVCSAAANQYSPVITSDGAGGAIVAWVDVRLGGGYDVFAQRMSPTGAAEWPANGVALCTAAYDQVGLQIVPDGASGAIVTWYDDRVSGSSNYDVYAQRIDRFGYLGNPEPVIAGVNDVPNDQGGKVKLSWNASYLDASYDPNLTGYDVLRSVPNNSAFAARRAGMRVVSDLASWDRAPGSLLVDPFGAQTYYWEYLTTITPLHYISAYSYLAPTASDSTAAGNSRTAFMVVAHNASDSMYWLSAPDSGYSVDNLGPATPAPFTGAYVAGATVMHWGANSESDLAGYRLYRGSSAGFTPGPGNLITAQTETDFSDSGPAGSYYKLSAIDLHGNESLYALLTPGGTLDAGGGVHAELSFARPVPDPAIGAPVTLRFSLPRDERATLVVIDAGGRVVRTLVSGTQTAGEHNISWNLRTDTGGNVPAGIYFLRLNVAGRTLTQRLATLR